MKEGDLQSLILEYLRRRGIWHRRMNSGAARMGGRRVRFGCPGLPDIFARGRNAIIWIEVKGEGGKLNPDQVKWKDESETFGDVYITARSLDDVRCLFEGRKDACL